MNTTTTTTNAATALDVFQAAAWLDDLWNSTAHALSADLIKWQCTTWGSGFGSPDWTDTATFDVVAAALDLVTYTNEFGSDELIVEVPLEHFERVRQIIDGIGECSEGWPWHAEDVQELGFEAVLRAAADALGMTETAILAKEDLCSVLRLR
ncbi:hypothetical protein ACFQW6_00750 [Nocardioides sp. GCM10028917]|uniref:hypothetical protein n=1 Tax=Nocardioides sp. GCM10028917 TaxID=3273408 RepID=UPI00361B4491